MSYCYRRARIVVPSNAAEFEQLLRDPNVTANKVDLYGEGNRAIVSSCRNGMPEQWKFNVDNRSLLLALIREKNIRITSHFDLTRKE